MKAWTLALLASAVAITAVSAPKGITQEELKKMTTAERKAFSDRMRYERTGGELSRPGTLKGEVSVIDCRPGSDSSDLLQPVADLRKGTRLAISVKRGTFDLANPNVGSGVTLFVVDDAKLPISLVAPECRWAAVNVAPLRTGRGSAPAFFKARTEKAFVRAFACLCGAASSNYKVPITGGVFKAEDLDGIVSTQLPPDVVARFAAYLAPVGIAPGQFVSYRRACQEGWAPAPTNEVQKVIWEKCKAEANTKPSNPMKITKEKK